jgi:hypothetical protein
MPMEKKWLKKLYNEMVKILPADGALVGSVMVIGC